MEYKIIGKILPVVEIKLDAGKSIYTQSGGMAYQTDGIDMETNARGGLERSLGRIFSGESIFMTTYKSNKDGAVIAFNTTVPGEIRALDMSALPNGFILQKGAFLCAEESVELKVVFNKRLSQGFFGGEGFIMQHATGSGMLFMEGDGDVIEKELAEGEVLKVSTGNIVAFEPTVSFGLESVRGAKNIFFSGEGFFLTKLVGPGKVLLQSQNFNDFANKVASYIPTPSSD